MKTNELLAGLDCLDHEIIVFVPSTIDGDKPAPELQEAKTVDTEKFLSSLFGGCTTTTGRGSWIDDGKNLINEAVNLCAANCTAQQLENNLGAVLRYCQDLCRDMSQYCISLKIDGRLFFIEQ